MYSISQDVKLHFFQQIHTPSGNQLTSSYFRSVTDYDTQTSFLATRGDGYVRNNEIGVEFMANAYVCTSLWPYS